MWACMLNSPNSLLSNQRRKELLTLPLCHVTESVWVVVSLDSHTCTHAWQTGTWHGNSIIAHPLPPPPPLCMWIAFIRLHLGSPVMHVVVSQ